MTRKLDKNIVSAQLEITRDVVAGWKSQVLFALNKLGILEQLAVEEYSAKELSSLLDLPHAPLQRLLHCAVASGYLEMRENRFLASPVVSAISQKGKAGYLGNWLNLYSHWYTTFTELADSVAQGKGKENVNDENEEGQEIFVKGMMDYAGYRGRDILNYLDFEGNSRLLDIGCGPAVYTAMFCEKFPTLYSTCYDLPGALEIARDYLREKNLLERVNFQPGNYLHDESFGDSYDIVFLSHVLHQEDEKTCVEILQKCRNALKPGGKIVIQAMFLNDSGIGPLYSSLHDILCFLIFPRGKNHTFRETCEFLRQAGFVDIKTQKMSLLNINSLIIAQKKAEK